MDDPGRGSKLRSRFFAAGKIALGLLLLWFLQQRGILDPKRVLEALLHEPMWIGLAFLFHGAVFALLGLRWRLVAMSAGIRFTHATSQRLTLISHFFSTCLPGNGAGDLVKGVLLSRTGFPFSDVLGTMAFDRVAGMAGLFLSWNLCMSIVSWMDPVVRPLLLPILPFTMTATVILVASLFAASTFTRLATRIAAATRPASLLGRIASQAVAMFERMSLCARPRTVIASLAISLVLQLSFLLTALCAARSLSSPLGLLEAGSILPLAALANALPISPGGIGVGESVASVALSRLGHPPNAGAELMIVVRMAVLVWAVVGGIVYSLSSIRREEPSG